MTCRENFHRMMRGEDYAHVPFDVPMTPPVVDEMERRTGTRDAYAVFDMDFAYAWADGPKNAERWRAAYTAHGIKVPEGAWVNDLGYVEKPASAGDVGAAYHLTEMFHPLAAIESMDDLLSLPWHDLHDRRWYAHLSERVQAVQQAGFVATLAGECMLFESSWYLRGMEALFIDLIEGNGIGDWLLDRMTERSILQSQAFAEAGGDLIRVGDDVGTQRGMMMSVPFWREHLKPRVAAVLSAAKAAGPVYVQYHSDGDISDIVDDLIEVGVDIINPVQPECMALETVVPRWKDKLAFSGMIGTQTTMPFGTPDDVRSQVGECEKWIHQGARMMIAPTHVLEPDVPWENVTALAEAVAAITP